MVLQGMELIQRMITPVAERFSAQDATTSENTRPEKKKEKRIEKCFSFTRSCALCFALFGVCIVFHHSSLPPPTARSLSLSLFLSSARTLEMSSRSFSPLRPTSIGSALSLLTTYHVKLGTNKARSSSYHHMF